MAEMAVDLKKNNQIQQSLDRAYSMIGIYNPQNQDDFCEWLNKFEYIANTVGVPHHLLNTLFNRMLVDSYLTFIKDTNKDLNFFLLSWEERINYYINTFSSSKEDNIFRKRFKYRKQYEEESIEIYVYYLQGIFIQCNYTNNSEEIFCEQFINGIRNRIIRDYLRKLPKLSLNQMLAKAVEIEKDNQIQKYLDQALSMIDIYTIGYKGDFCEWLNKFEYVANTIGVPDHKIKELFKYMVDDGVHINVQEKYKNVDFLQLSYEEKIDYYFQIFLGLTGINIHRKRFKCREQYEQETIEIYADDLQKKFMKCGYNNFTNKILVTQFINGLRDQELKKYLSEIPYLEFQEMVNTAVELEKGNLIPYYLHRAYSMIHIYNPDNKDDFCEWINRFEYVAHTIGIPHNILNTLFNKMLVDSYVRFVQGTNKDFNFHKLTCEERINYYLNTFSSSREDNLFRRRFKFRKQYEKESIQTYAYYLRTIFSMCNYTINREGILCEQFINGIRNDIIREHLRKLPKLSFNQIVAEAVEFEKDNPIQKYLDQALSMIDIYTIGYKGDFCEWLNEFEYIADTIGVPDNNMFEFFKYMVDDGIHMVIQEHHKNDNFLQLSFEDKINCYVNLFSSIRDSHPYRKRFKCRKQYKQETLEIFVGYLRKIVSRCHFRGDRDEKLCNQFLKGIRNEELKKYLSQIPCLDFNEIVKMAIEFEKNNL